MSEKYFEMALVLGQSLDIEIAILDDNDHVESKKLKFESITVNKANQKFH